MQTEKVMKAYELFDNAPRKRYEFRIDGLTPMIEYAKPADGVIVLTHTEVPRELAGRGIGSRLVEKALADIDRLEDLSAKIFAQVKSDPSKLPQIRKFMDYYLPTTLKLLNASDRMGAQGVSGENIDATMQRVESMMSTIVAAFEKQLDMLFGSEAMDISTDITVLEHMMKREGLSEDTGELHAESGTASASQDDIKLEL